MVASAPPPPPAEAHFVALTPGSDGFKKETGRLRKYGADGKPMLTLPPMPISLSIPLSGDFPGWKQKVFSQNNERDEEDGEDNSHLKSAVKLEEDLFISNRVCWHHMIPIPLTDSTDLKNGVIGEQPVTPPLSKEPPPRSFYQKHELNGNASTPALSSISGAKTETSSLASARSSSTDLSMSNASDLETEWVEQDEPGVYISIRGLPGGNCEVRRVRFSREKFGEMNARIWWEFNNSICDKKWVFRWFKTFQKSEVFADMLFHLQQILMVTVATALTTIGYEIEVYSLEDSPVHTVWKNIGVSVSIVEADKKIMIDWLNYDAILVNSLEAKEAISGYYSLLQEPFKSLPLIWTINEKTLATRCKNYISNGQIQIIDDCKSIFNRATAVVFPNHALPMFYAPFDAGNYFALLYKLSGDYNPLHADPNIAEVAGMCF
ncbi:hypothetical protein L2E82_24385 [Cichorium intybus]|uniref:Uncharacterized protein n=1 Tax=Cichorium intybus TaxID=13427 RepID=A0ACB9E1Q1_CICIN|nr:hypothetical protein L2E82_24385 [Cichorium intybus]